MTNHSKLLTHMYSNDFRELDCFNRYVQDILLKKIHLGYFSKFKSPVLDLLIRYPFAF